MAEQPKKKGDETVKVMVRCRPMNKKELDNGSKDIVKVDSQSNSIFLNDKQFTYDNVFGIEDPQESIYNCSAFQLVESVVQGYNGTIFAYGQTGCGKTHTMMGYAHNDVDKGIIPRTFDQLVEIIQNQDSEVKFLVRCSFIEIYNEEIHDLLSKDVKFKYELKESADKGVYVKDLNMMVVKTVKEMDMFLECGNSKRSTGQTLMNAESSRSHSIFTLYVEQSIKDNKENERITLGKLNLVDLAGSERLSKTGAQGDRLKEATKINLSLSALGNVISALVDGKSKHIPYRDSKLTRLLQDSLGGNTKTIMIANISPADYNYDETIGTLRYASRAKNITNKPKVNEDPKDALLKEYSEEIKKLKLQLEGANSAGNGLTSSNSNNQNGDLEVTSVQHSQVIINNSGLMKQQNQLKQQNEEIEDQLQKERSERAKLEQMMNDMKQNMFSGGGADEAQKQNYNNFKAKLEDQQQAHQQYVDEKQQEEEELLLKEFVYQDLQEEVEHLRKVTNKLRKKYEQESQDTKDLEYEHIREKEDTQESIKIQQKEINLFKQILKHVFKSDEMGVLKVASKWNDHKNNYIVPPFLFRNKKLRFPKLNYQQGIDLIENEKENREMEFKLENTPTAKQNTKGNKHKQGKFAMTDDFNEYSMDNKQGQYSKQKNNQSQMDDFTQNFTPINKINENEEQEQDYQLKQKVKLEPLRNNGNQNNNQSNEPIPKNHRNLKLQPLSKMNPSNKMEVNFKATIHINNNGDIYY